MKTSVSSSTEILDEENEQLRIMVQLVNGITDVFKASKARSITMYLLRNSTV